MQGRSPLRVADPEDRVASVMAEHGRTLLRTANHFSLCHDDALDAYQRALEIFLRRADRVLPETELAWLKVVVKHEAMAIRSARSESVSNEELDLDARPEPTPAPARRARRGRRAGRPLRRGAARAQARRAPRADAQGPGLLLRGDRPPPRLDLHEGQPRNHRGPAAVHEGLPGDRVRRGLRAAPPGDRRARRRDRERADIVEIRPHLRHCTACRATVRRLHVPAGTRVKLLLPGFLLAPIASLPDGVKAPDEFVTRGDDIELIPPPDVPAAAAADAPAGHAIDLAGHLQLPLDLPERTRGIRLGRVKEEAYALLHRTQSSDAAAGAYIATSTGGGRIATIATIIGFCVSGAGAGALCVATGVVQAPGWIFGLADRAPAPRPAADAKPKRSPRGPARLSASSRATEVVARATPSPSPAPRREPRKSSPKPSASEDPSQGTKPISHESAPISQPAQGSTSEFGAESGGSSSGSSSAPASAPATGGDEFSP